MPRYMVDSTSAADALAQPADMYAGYTDGRYVNVGTLRAGTSKPVVEISAIGTNTGTVGDCEPGCIWPQTAIVNWVVMRRESGVDPTVYVGAANLASVVAAFNAAGVAQPVAYWTAHYTNAPHFCGEGCSYGRGLGVNVVATQYGGDLIGHYDANHVADYWPGIDGAERPAGGGTVITPPDQSEEDDMPYSEAELRKFINEEVGKALVASGTAGAGDWSIGQYANQDYTVGAKASKIVSDETNKVLRSEGITGGIAALLARPAGAGGSVMDPAVQAKLIADLLDDDLAKSVADLLSKRLAA